MPACKKCNDTGVIETGNNDFPCTCSAGDTAVFNTTDGQVEGRFIKERMSPYGLPPAPKRTGPITPAEVVKKKREAIPEQVFEAFNGLIARHWDGYEAGFTQDEAVKRITELSALSENQIYEQHYLDVEEAYREAGWDVKYDKPGFNESGPATFVFKKKQKR